jgi:hypothetical protein
VSTLVLDGLLGVHVLFALLWVAATFVGLMTLLRLEKSPTDSSLKKRASMLNMLVAAGGGITVLVGAGFYYYINFYHPSYATSARGLPLVDAGAALGVIVFIWQMAQGSRIRRALKTNIPSQTQGSQKVPSALKANLPKSWMLIVPALLLLVAFALMVGGSMM